VRSRHLVGIGRVLLLLLSAGGLLLSVLSIGRTDSPRTGFVPFSGKTPPPDRLPEVTATLTLDAFEYEKGTFSGTVLLDDTNGHLEEGDYFFCGLFTTKVERSVGHIIWPWYVSGVDASNAPHLGPRQASFGSTEPTTVWLFGNLSDYPWDTYSADIHLGATLSDKPPGPGVQRAQRMNVIPNGGLSMSVTLPDFELAEFEECPDNWMKFPSAMATIQVSRPLSVRLWTCVVLVAMYTLLVPIHLFRSRQDLALYAVGTFFAAFGVRSLLVPRGIPYMIRLDGVVFVFVVLVVALSTVRYFLLRSPGPPGTEAPPS
jgi:hypothetical protein